MNINEIKTAVMELRTAEELSQVYSVYKYQRNILNSQLKNQFSRGDKVIFNHSKRGDLKGTIRKINKKYIQVDIKNSDGIIVECWNCIPSSLTFQSY